MNLRMRFVLRISICRRSKNDYENLSWSRELTMKYVYSGGFVIKKCMERLKKHLEWREDPAFQVMTPLAEEYLVRSN